MMTQGVRIKWQERVKTKRQLEASQKCLTIKGKGGVELGRKNTSLNSYLKFCTVGLSRRESNDFHHVRIIEANLIYCHSGDNFRSS